MRTVVTRFTCDNPDCDDFVDVEGVPDTPTSSAVPPAPLPDGWVAFHVEGPAADGSQVLVHASKPKCAAKLAEAQVAGAVDAAAEREKAAEEARKRAEKVAEEASETMATEDQRQAEEEAEKDS